MSSLIELKGKDVQAYDMIVSTVPIPYENIDYIMVSPLLNEEDANQVKQYIKRKIPLILNKKRSPKEEAQQADVPDMLETAESIGRYMEVIQDVLRHFTLAQLKTNPDHSMLLLELFQQLKKDGLIRDPEKAAVCLAEREKQGGLGIPGTNMALYHLKNDEIVLPFSKCLISAPPMKWMAWTEIPSG